VVIVGAGIAGLAAAYFLRDTQARVTVLEGSPRLGGKLTSSEVAGVMLDEGAEALLARRPEGADLIAAVGLGDQLKPAGTASSAIWTRGELRRLPRRQFMGVPADIDDLAASGVVSPEGADRARHEHPAPSGGDTSVAAYVGGRVGGEVVDRLVDPLLGGVYAGRSDELSFEATLGPLAAAASKYATLTEAVTSLLPAPPPAGTAPTPKPVFVSLAGGLGSLPPVLAKASGADVRTGVMVRGLSRTPEGWKLVAGSAADPEVLDADAVILAVPGRPASRVRDLGEPHGRQRARRDPVREHGHSHAGLPACRRGRRLWRAKRLSGTRGRRPGSESGHVLHHEVAAPAGRPRAGALLGRPDR
jgi:oxygen-dependent protoporphyrinogen oxidase